MEEKSGRSLKRSLGFFSTVAIIVGQMIGSGVYMAPQGLAELSNPVAAILALIITGTGTCFLAVSFAKLSRHTEMHDSAILATKRAFGDLPGFWAGWSYWCGCWVSNGAIILAGLSYLSYFIPPLATNSIQRCVASIIVIWFYTVIDIWGIKQAGIFNLVVTIIKLVPLAFFAAIAVIHFDAANFTTTSSPEVEGMSVLPLATAYMLWSFIGFEGASMNAEEIESPEKIGVATISSTIAVVAIYLVLIVIAIGAMPQSELAGSASPFADIMYKISGAYWAGAFIAIGGSISALGCAGPWILSGGVTAYSLGKGKLLPETLAKVSDRGTPRTALLVNGTLMTIIMIIAWSTHEGSLYNFFIMLATMSYLVVYAFGAASEIMLSKREIKPFNPWNFVKCSAVSLIGLTYAIYTIYGSGSDYVLYGFLLLLLGLPIHIYLELKKQSVNGNKKSR